MNLVDKTIELFSPQRALARARARVQLEAIEEIRGYDGAKSDRHTAGWTATGTSANAETQSAMGKLRNNSRDLGRNEPIAASIFRKMPAYIVGTGIIPWALTKDADEKKILAENWEHFNQHCDPQGLQTFYAMQRLGVRAVVESGEVLIRWHHRPVSQDFPSLLQCELLEGDFIDSMRNEELSNGNFVLQGVEFDKDGRRVAYWLFDTHPGEISMAKMFNHQSKRVPADLISHMFDILRPGQVRGVPWMTPSITRTRHSADYDLSERIRKRVAACFGVIIEQENPDQYSAPTKVETTGKKRRREEVSPGMILYTEPGQKASAVQPAPDSGYTDFTVTQQKQISSGAGLPHEVATGDNKGTNYSSRRGSIVDFYTSVDDWQSNMVLPMMCSPAWNMVHQVNARMGKGPAAWPVAYWQVPARPWVDPKNEAAANEMDMRAGTVSFPQACRRKGLDPEVVIAEHEEWVPRLNAVGINNFAAAATASAEPETDDEENEEDDEQKQGSSEAA